MTAFRRKRCICCGVEKVVSKRNFYRHKQMGDGYLNKCIDCTKRDVSANRELKIAYYKAYDAQRANRPDRVAARQRYRKTTAGKAAIRRAHAAQRVISPLKRRARTLIGNALRNGTVVRKPCEVCGELKAQAHHDDYNKPLAVRWLCQKHHTEHHRRERASVHSAASR